MNANELSKIQYFKSMPRAQAALNIDTEKGIIYDVVMCQVGDASGHGVALEQEFIDSLVAFDKKTYGKDGVKCLFDHPSWLTGSMGSQLGFFKNYRVVEDKAVADLYLLEAAKASPTHGDMHSWVLSIAQEAPNFIMCSITFAYKAFYQKDSAGKKIYCWICDAEGNWISSNTALGKIYAELGEHYRTDLVEEGAATSALFKNNFITEPPIQEVKPKNKMFSIAKWIKGESQDVTTPTAEQLAELKTGLETAKAEFAKAEQGRKDAEAKIAELSKKIEDDATAHTAALAAKDDKITELEAKAAAVHTGGDDAEDDVNEDEEDTTSASYAQKQRIKMMMA